MSEQLSLLSSVATEPPDQAANAGLDRAGLHRHAQEAADHDDEEGDVDGAEQRPRVVVVDVPGCVLDPVEAVDRRGERVDGSNARLLLVAGGWNPNLALWSQAGGALRFDKRIGAYVPDGTLKHVEVVGSATGVGLPDSIAPTWDGAGDETVTFVDLERDATVADIRQALGAGLRSIEHVKRYTTIGTGSDQGKTGGVVASAVAAALLLFLLAESFIVWRH